METQQHEWERELNQLRGIGDLEELNAQIATLKSRMSACQEREQAALADMRAAFRGQPLSWAFAGTQWSGPGKTRGTRRPARYPQHVAESSRRPARRPQVYLRVGPSSWIRATRARRATAGRAAGKLRGRPAAVRAALRRRGLVAAGTDTREFARKRHATLAEYTAARDEQARADVELKQAEIARSRIDDARVRTLTDELAAVDAKIGNAVQELGRIAERIAEFEQQARDREQELDPVVKRQQANRDLITRRDVADDLRVLAERVQSRLEGEYVARSPPGCKKFSCRSSAANQTLALACSVA